MLSSVVMMLKKNHCGIRVKDKHGNANDCMVQVEVQDKIKPRCTFTN